MSKPWLSVIMPCHHGERWLPRALQSIVEQAEREIEVILVDSSASDNDLQIAAQFAGRLDIRMHHRPDLPQWTAKTNFAAAEATADWVCMLHQDDFWLPERCAAVHQWLEGRSDGAMHLHDAYIVDESGKKLGTWRCPLPAHDAPIAPDLLFERLLVQEFIAIPAPTIRRELLLGVGGLDDSLQQTADWDLYLKLSRAGSAYYHPYPLACFRIHRASQTVAASRKLADYRAQLETVFERHVGELDQANRRAIAVLARTSIDVNSALAAANAGRIAELPKALWAVLKLGPRGIWRYVTYSRILERALPRLRARFAGAF